MAGPPIQGPREWLAIDVRTDDIHDPIAHNGRATEGFLTALDHDPGSGLGTGRSDGYGTGLARAIEQR
jgi:hypothetical protein